VNFNCFALSRTTPTSSTSRRGPGGCSGQARACLAHREFAMASGAMTDAEFLAFNEAWMAAGDNGFQ
jgi:hypothetical protein